MDHFSYQTPSVIAGAHHHHQQQPLTPISNLTSNSYHHQQPEQSPAQPNTLPPLHGQPAGQYAYSQPLGFKSSHHEPSASRLPHTPETPGSVDGSALPHIAPQSHMNVQEPAVSSYGSVHHGYQDTSPNTYHAPAHHQSGFSIGAMPHYSQPSQHHMGEPMSALYDRGQSQSASFSFAPQSQNEASMAQSDARPLPVVGSQGRRGILPSVTSRAPPPVGSTPDGSMRGVTQPAKNSENKYPCNYCSKTYLHLKHLKRHHLRHTGERPYQCSLCHETFCRSDILKRHFNKCAIRRGNPSGATHLTHAQAHLQKPPRSAPSSSNGSTAPPPMNGLTSISTNQPPSSFNNGPWSATTARSSATASMDQNQFPHSVGESNRTSRSSSLMGHDTSGEEDRKRYSTGTNLAPLNHSVDHGSHNAPTSERPFSYPFQTDRHIPTGFREQQTNGYYSHVSMAPHSEQQQLPPVSGYMRTNGWPHTYQTSAAEHQTSWTSAFVAGGQDSVMYGGQH